MSRHEVHEVLQVFWKGGMQAVAAHLKDEFRRLQPAEAIRLMKTTEQLMAQAKETLDKVMDEPRIAEPARQH